MTTAVVGAVPAGPMTLEQWEARAQNGALPAGALYRLGQAVAEDRRCVRRAAKAWGRETITEDDYQRLRREASARARRYVWAGGDMDDLPAPARCA